MKRMEKIVYGETKYFPMIKNSWGWMIQDESEFTKLKS
jgi:hypothetical protein